MKKLKILMAALFALAVLYPQLSFASLKPEVDASGYKRICNPSQGTIQVDIQLSNYAPKPYCEKVACKIIWKNTGLVPLNASYTLQLPSGIAIEETLQGRGTITLGAGQEIVEAFEFTVVAPGLGNAVSSISVSTAEPVSGWSRISEVTFLSGSEDIVNRKNGNFPGDEPGAVRQCKPSQGRRTIVDQNTVVNTNTYYSTGRLYLRPGTTVQVGSGATLHINNSELYTCDELDHHFEIAQGGQVVISQSKVNGIYVPHKVWSGQFDFTLSPNPASEWIRIAFQGNGAASFHLPYRILDVSGKQVAAGYAADQTDAEITHLPSGYYYVEITTDGRSLRKPFVKASL